MKATFTIIQNYINGIFELIKWVDNKIINRQKCKLYNILGFASRPINNTTQAIYLDTDANNEGLFRYMGFAIDTKHTTLQEGESMIYNASNNNNILIDNNGNINFNADKTIFNTPENQINGNITQTGNISTNGNIEATQKVKANTGEFASVTIGPITISVAGGKMSINGKELTVVGGQVDLTNGTITGSGQ